MNDNLNKSFPDKHYSKIMKSFLEIALRRG